jgi:hypothetical protein
VANIITDQYTLKPRCCNASVNGNPGNYKWALVSGTTYGCCDSSKTSLSPDGNTTYCCSVTSPAWTIDTVCCPSNQIMNDPSGNPRCCGFGPIVAGQYTWATQMNSAGQPTSNFVCCPNAQLSFNGANKYCCSQASVNFTSDNYCCPTNRLLKDSSNNVRCCASGPVDQTNWIFTIWANNTGQSTCCLNNQTIVTGTGQVQCCGQYNTNWTNDSPCCPVNNVLIDGTYRACCGFAVGGGVYVSAKNAITNSNMCCPPANITIDTNATKWCCSSSPSNWTSGNRCCPTNNVLIDQVWQLFVLESVLTIVERNSSLLPFGRKRTAIYLDQYHFYLLSYKSSYNSTNWTSYLLPRSILPLHSWKSMLSWKPNAAYGYNKSVLCASLLPHCCFCRIPLAQE